ELDDPDITMEEYIQLEAEKHMGVVRSLTGVRNYELLQLSVAGST
ncbi:hypothetical protein Tco_1494535, partial [Tanacetum coccineum]